MHGRTDGRTDNVKTVYPLQTKFAGGIKTLQGMILAAITAAENTLQPRFMTID